MRISDWSSDVCSSDLQLRRHGARAVDRRERGTSLAVRAAAARSYRAGADRGVAGDAAGARGERRRPWRISNDGGRTVNERVIRGRIDRSGALVSADAPLLRLQRSEEHTSDLQTLMRISNALFCL